MERGSGKRASSVIHKRLGHRGVESVTRTPAASLQRNAEAKESPASKFDLCSTVEDVASSQNTSVEEAKRLSERPAL